MPDAASKDVNARTIAVIGCGVIGLPTALLLARAGHRVIGVDINQRIIDSINDWQMDLIEPELISLAAEPGVRGRFSAQAEMPEADVFMIAAPTPLDERRKVCDMSAVEAVTKNIIPKLCEGNLIILESTVPPLTCRDFIAPRLLEHGWVPGENCNLAFCPERVLPGTAYNELINNDRVIGGHTPKCAELSAEVYRSFVTGELILTNSRTAELCKLTENAYRDVCIAFANEMSLVAEGLGIDADELIGLANRHPRVDILRPGIGVGGHCLPIDPYFVSESDPFHTRMILTARRVNDEMPSHTLRRIREHLADVENPRIAGFGAAYKPDTPDERESPAMEVWELLREAGFELSVYDPHIEQFQYSDFKTAIDGCNVIIVLVPHKLVLSQIEEHAALIEERGIKVLRF